MLQCPIWCHFSRVATLFVDASPGYKGWNSTRSSRSCPLLIASLTKSHFQFSIYGLSSRRRAVRRVHEHHALLRFVRRHGMDRQSARSNSASPLRSPSDLDVVLVCVRGVRGPPPWGVRLAFHKAPFPNVLERETGRASSLCHGRCSLWTSAASAFGEPTVRHLSIQVSIS